MAASERELVANILAAPEEDAPRLVFADWLLERGDPRGDLVVAQCALERAEAADAPLAERAPLREQVTKLIETHKETWLDPLNEIAPGYYKVRRGLVEHVELVEPTFDSDALREAAPVLRSFSAPRGAAGEFLACLDNFPVDELRLAAVPADVYASPVVGKLHRLELRRMGYEATEIGKLGSGLRHFRLELAEVGEGHPLIGRLLASSARGSLRSLALRNLNLIELQSLGELAALEVLELDGCLSGPLAPPDLPALTTIALADTKATPLAIVQAFPSVRRLRCTHTLIDDDAIASFAASPLVARLRRVDLSYALLSRAAARALAESPHLRGLVELRLEGNSLDDATLDYVRERLATTDIYGATPISKA